MPGKLKVQIVAGRNLPVMDRSSELTDAFVEVKFGSVTYKTDVYRKSLNPQWNSEWYRFEVDDEDLQDEPLQIRVLDHDTYSAHDAIGKVYIDLDPLLSRGNANVISGWFPIYDTMHGIRGELNVTVKVGLFTDFNKFRQSSCGVQFFCTSGVPAGFRIQYMQGFVEELVVNDDPEHQWIDKIRSMRASNEARQLQFSKLTGELQRRIGLKVLEMGGNAVIAYRQCFDLEGESGIVVRAVGTSVSLTKQWSHHPPISASPHCDSASPVRDTPLTADDAGQHLSPLAVTPLRTGASSPLKVESGKEGGAAPGTAVKARRSSDSDLSTPPKGGGSLTGSSGSATGSATKTPFKMPQPTSIDHIEFPFFSMRSYPPGFIVHLGAFVSAKSVKLLDRIHNPDEPETRDTWWTELRTEVRSHARSMGCHAVIGYYETTAICDEIIILSACGTAAVVNFEMKAVSNVTQGIHTMGIDRHSAERDMDKYGVKDTTSNVTGRERKLSGQTAQTQGPSQLESARDHTKKLSVDVNLANDLTAHNSYRTSESDEETTGMNCQLCHIPYNEASLPFQVQLVKCAICRSRKVPNVLFTTVEPPPELPLIGKGCFIQARICRTKKELKGESHAKEISDSLPFMEIELHSQLIHKLWIKGMNTLFGLRVTFCVGDKLLVAVATATGVFSACLPAPTPPRVVGTSDGSTSSGSNLLELQKRVTDEISKNVDRYNLYVPEFLQGEHSPPSAVSLSEEVTEEDSSGTEADITTGNKDIFVLQIDDAEDADIVAVLLDPPPPAGFDICNTEVMPGVPNSVCSLQTFTKVWRGQLSLTTNKAFSQVFNYLLRSLYFKLRKLAPCTLCHLDFDIDLPEDDEIQISITGTCAGLGDPQLVNSDAENLRNNQAESSHTGGKQGNQCEDMMFDMEMISDSGPASTHNVHTPGTSSGTSGETSSHNVPSNSSRIERPKVGLMRHSPVLCKGLASMKEDRKIKYHTSPKHCEGIELTPLPYIPGTNIEKYLGHLNFFIVRETTSLSGMGGLNGFIHSFIAEVMAICRAHVAALGGNALVSYQMSECVLEDNIQKNQSQCLVNVYGDVVYVQYGNDISSHDTRPHQHPTFTTPENTRVPVTAPPLVGNSPILRLKTPQKSSPKYSRQSAQT